MELEYHPIMTTKFMASTKDKLTLSIHAMTCLDIEQAQQVASKVYKVLHRIKGFPYPEQLPQDNILELIRHKYFESFIGIDGQSITKKSVKTFMFPTHEDDWEEPTRKDMKHKIYRIRQRAKEEYYGPELSEYILKLSSKEIFNMIFYEDLNTHGYAR